MNPSTRTAVTAVLAVVLLAGLGLLGYVLWCWHVPFVGGWIAKLALTGKLIKMAVVVAVAVVAGATALARHLRGRHRHPADQ